MGLAPGEKALMYALGGIARGGATRGGYTSVDPFISIGGEHVGTARPDKTKRVLMASLSITDNLELAPNTCAFVTTGFVRVLGAPIIITLGTKNSLTRLFGGVVLKAEQTYLADAPTNVAYRVDAIDFSWLLNRRLVNARYVNWSGTDIALDLMTKNTQGFTTFGVQLGLAVLDEISFTNATMSDALNQLAKRLGAIWYVDYGGRSVTTYGDLHFFTGSESQVVPPTPLTPTHPSMRHLSRVRDLSQIVTRVFYEGGGANAQAQCVPGETILPVETIAWYNANGGYVATGPQRLLYQRIFAGGGGTLVGPGATPSAAPQANIAMGAGVTPGAHDYAVSFVTGSGESLVGPRVTVPVSGALAPPATAVGVAVKPGGAGPDAGAHNYGVSFVTPSGETVPSPLTPYTQGVIATPVNTVIQIQDNYDGNGYGNPYVKAGDMIFFCVTYQADPVNPGTPPFPNQTDLGPFSAQYIIKQTLNTFSPPGYCMNFSLQIPMSMDPNVKFVHLWMSINWAGLIYVGPSQANTATQQYYYKGFFFQQFAIYPQYTQPVPPFNPILGGVNLSALPIGPTGVTARKIYRTAAGGSQLKLVGTVADNTTTTALDNNPDSALGANALTVGTAQAAQVALSGIPTGGATVTQRKIYRSAANTPTLLKLLATLADNSTTTFLDALADAALGVNAPTGDTSGLKQPDGQVIAGSTSLIVAGAAAFRATGGWALLPGGQTIRYASISGNALAGIPPTGPGAILATINYNATITAAPALEGAARALPARLVRVRDRVLLALGHQAAALRALWLHAARSA